MGYELNSKADFQIVPGNRGPDEQTDGSVVDWNSVAMKDLPKQGTGSDDIGKRSLLALIFILLPGYSVCSIEMTGVVN